MLRNDTRKETQTMFIAIQRYCDAEDPFWSNCKILGVFKTESSAKSACDAAYDEILKYDGDCFIDHTPNADEYKSLYYHPYTRYSWRIEQYEIND